MKRLLLMFSIVIYSVYLNAQKYDLIVNTSNDSIACIIDSITPSNIFFTFKNRGIWINSSISQEDILKHLHDTIDKNLVIFYPNSSYIKEIRKFDLGNDNPFAHQYILGHSGFSMKKGETYYGTYALIAHRIQHGFSDRFTMSFGAGFPGAATITAHYSYPLSTKSVFAIHNTIIIVIYGEMYGNLTYGQYTYGNEFNNVSIGLGLLISNNNKTLLSPAINLSGQIRIVKNLYFIQESYVFKMYNNNTFVSSDGNKFVDHQQISLSFVGTTGISYISKRRPWNSFKLGAVYGYTALENSPEGYMYQYKNQSGGWLLLIYNRKFRE